MVSKRGSGLIGLLVLLVTNGLGAAENVVVVTWDGFRWQELFGGAEERLISKDGGGIPSEYEAEIRQKFWREAPQDRREALLPFFWQVLAKQGQVFGDPARRSVSRVTNGKNFSYPGYNEMFTGFADDRIDSNNKVPNPNVNVLEFLHRQPAFAGRVAAFATWDVIEFVLNRDRSGMVVHTGWLPITDMPLTAGQQRVNELVDELPRLWRGNAYDWVSYQAAREHLLKHRPRVLYLGLGETDEWAHARRYDLYLEAARRSDAYLRDLWETLQSQEQYRGKTALVVTTDHGRGETPRDWTNHNADTPGAEFIWIGVLGPDVPALGIRERVPSTQSQVARTLAQLVESEFMGGASPAAPPLPLNP